MIASSSTSCRTKKKKIDLDLVISCLETFPLILLHSLVEKLIYGNFIFSTATEIPMCFVFCMLQNGAVVLSEAFGHLMELSRPVAS